MCSDNSNVEYICLKTKLHFLLIEFYDLKNYYMCILLLSLKTKFFSL